SGFSDARSWMMRFSSSRSGFSNSSASSILDEHATLTEHGLDPARHRRVGLHGKLAHADDHLVLGQEHVEEERRAPAMLLADGAYGGEERVEGGRGHAHADPAGERPRARIA